MGLSSSKEKASETSNQTKLEWNIGSRLGGFVYDSTSYSLKELTAIPEMAKQFVTDPSYQKVLRNYATIFMSHYLWLLAANTLNYWSQQGLSTEDDTEDSSTMVYWAFWMTGALLNIVINLYNLREAGSTMVQTLLTNQQLNRAKQKIAVKKNPCEQGCKNPLVADLVATTLEDLAGQTLLLSLTGINYFLRPVPAFLQCLVWWQVYGRRIARSSRMADERCEEHEVISSGNSLALGMGYWGSTKALGYLFEMGPVKLPSFYLFLLEQILLNIHIVGARHLTSPYVKKQNQNVPFDLIAVFEKGLSIGILSLIQFLNRIIPRFFDDNDEPFPWKKFYRQFKQWSEYPPLVSTYALVVPKMFESSNDFINDPVIASTWPGFRNRLVSIADGILNFKNEYPRLYSILSKAPTKILQKLLRMKFNMNKEVSAVLLDLFLNPQSKTKAQVRLFRDYLMSLQLSQELQAVTLVVGEDTQRFIEHRVQARMTGGEQAAPSSSQTSGDEGNKEVQKLPDKVDESARVLKRKNEPGQMRLFKRHPPSQSAAVLVKKKEEFSGATSSRLMKNR